jgi:chemotaxis protein MotD
MTSGVNQALPQVLVPASDGKGARYRAPQGNFAETLGIGKAAKQLKSGEKADRQHVEMQLTWRRLAAELDTTIDRSHGIASSLDSLLTKEENETTDGELAADEEISAEDSQPFAVGRHAGEPAQAAADATSSFAAPASAQPKQAGSNEPATAGGDELPSPVAHDGGEPDAPAVSHDKPAPENGRHAQSFVLMGGSEHTEITRFEPASKPLTVPAEQHATDTVEAKETPPDTFVEPAKTTPRVAVLAQQNIPAPMPSTAVVLVESMAAGGRLEPAATRLAVDAIHASATHASAQSLKIQLHPAELGMVTATLRFAGEQLSIELQVENHEAHRRLSSDSEAIVKSLRDLGYDIERVSVLQPSIASPAAVRSEGTAMQGRVGDQFGSGTASGDSGASGRQASTDGGNAGRGGQQHTSAQAEQATGGGVYI